MVTSETFERRLRDKQAGAYLRNIRKTKGLTQTEISSKAGISKSYLSKLENGKRPFTPERIEFLSRPYELDFRQRDELLASAGFIPKSGMFTNPELSISSLTVKLNRVEEKLDLLIQTGRDVKQEQYGSVNIPRHRSYDSPLLLAIDALSRCLIDHLALEGDHAFRTRLTLLKNRVTSAAQLLQEGEYPSDIQVRNYFVEWGKLLFPRIQALMHQDLQYFLRISERAKLLMKVVESAKVTPTDPEFLTFWADALYLNSEFAAAIDVYNKAINEKSEYQRARLHRTVCLIHVGDVEESLPTLDILAESQPRSAIINFFKAFVLERMGNIEEALESIDLTLTIDSSFKEAHNNRSAHLMRLERYEEGSLSGQKAIVLDPLYALALSNVAGNLIKLKDYSGAQMNLDLALSLEPRFAFGAYNMACLKSLTREPVEAIGLLKKAIAINPSFRSPASMDPDLDFVRCNPNYKSAFSELVAHLPGVG